MKPFINSKRRMELDKRNFSTHKRAYKPQGPGKGRVSRMKEDQIRDAIAVLHTGYTYDEEKAKNIVIYEGNS